MYNITISAISRFPLWRGLRGGALMFIAILPLLFGACNPTKKLQEGEYVLNKNFIIDKDTKIDKKDIVYQVYKKLYANLLKCY